MPEYRLYFLDRNSRIKRTVEFECSDDERAIGMIEEHVAGTAMELWRGERCLREFAARQE
jgi:hypothetical protein